MRADLCGGNAYGFCVAISEYSSTASMKNCSFIGSLKANKNYGEACMIGNMVSNSPFLSLNGCYAQAYLEGNWCCFIKNVAGYARMQNCYGLLDIESTTNNAGAVLNGSTNSNIEDSYFVLNVTNSNESAKIGSIYALNNNLNEEALLGTLTNVYYNKDTLPKAFGFSDDITYEAGAKTTAELKTQSTYEGWDFTNVWAINPNKNNGYPYLRNTL